MCGIAAQSGFPIETIEFHGSEYPRSALLTVTGLHAPMPFSEAALRDAAQKLQDTGFFRSVQFRYEPARSHRGYAVNFDLAEDTDSLPARIDIPDADENDVWTALEAADPLLRRKVPTNEVAEARYIKAIEAWCAQHGQPTKIAARQNGGNMQSRDQLSLVFEQADLPIIAAVRFIDTYVIKPVELEKVLEPIAANSGYSESRFRRLLDLNIRPIYEEQGFLGVVFDHIRLREDDSGHLTVETHVVDGRAYNLGNVTLEGPSLPEAEMRKAAAFHIGERANWTQFKDGVAEMERVLTKQGYLHEHMTVERTLHSKEGTVDAIVHVAPGVQYRFGKLALTGFPEDLRQLGERRWTLRPGQVLDGEYPYAFLHDFMKELRGTRGKVAISFEPGAGPDVMDVSIEMR